MENTPKPASRLRHFLGSPWLHLITGLLLTLTAGVEIIENLDVLFEEQSNIGGHHGLFLYGLVTTLNKVAELLEGAMTAGKGIAPHHDTSGMPSKGLQE